MYRHSSSSCPRILALTLTLTLTLSLTLILTLTWILAQAFVLDLEGDIPSFDDLDFLFETVCAV